MCGIAGLWSPQGEGQDPLESILRQQQARGPDAQGTARLQAPYGTLHLGSNRLAVIDLSPAANMPFWCNEGKSCLTYNGEIYNYLELRQELQRAGYAFRGKSDTEVLLAALLTWGIGALERLNGMFAFALWNDQEQVLWLGRDRFGEKPICYYLSSQADGHFAFASNPISLARLFGLSPDLNYVARGLRFLIYEDDGPMTAFSGLRSLPPGHWAEVKFTQAGPTLRSSRYYSLPDEVEKTAQTCLQWTPTQAVEKVSAILDDSVRLRLRTDVAMGLSLSGGIDSTLVALLSERHCLPLRCFSYARPGGGASEGDTTEGPQIRTWAAQHQHDVKFVWPDGQAFLEGYQRCLDCQQGPFPGLSVVAQNCIYYDVRQSGVKVMLGGQGADEAFLGYRKFLGFGLQEALRQRQFAVILSLLMGLVSTVFSEISTWQTLLAMRSRYLSRGGLTTGLKGMPASTWDLHSMDQGLRHRHILDLLRFSLPTLLRYEDRNSMGNSVESRLPFLDHRLVELACALPLSLQLRGGYLKWPLRALLDQLNSGQGAWLRSKRNFDVRASSQVLPLLDWISSRLQQLSRQDGAIRAYCSDVSVYRPEALARSSTLLNEANTLLWLEHVA